MCEVQEESDNVSCHLLAILVKLMGFKIQWDSQTTFARQVNVIQHQMKVSDVKRWWLQFSSN